jgi:hypothetical protein
MHQIGKNQRRVSKRAVKPIQLALFDRSVIRSAHLVAVDHPRPVHYDMWLEGFIGCYHVRKASGVKGWKPDCRQWQFSTLTEAEKEFNRKLKSKTNPRRKSPRKYILAGPGP